ncbi:MAG: hypothetical protein M0D53_16150 [Flavobacterium sp. JAD_PAG50586_2]|nr:MAG: hypothetical protein M0D53_16150 [Flavobacterium sp. JAD_PAG50586_2]
MADSENLRKDIEFLLDKFKLERYIYLAITLSSIILLVILIIELFKDREYAKILAMLAPTGLITFSVSRILKMWTDCVSLLKTNITHNNEMKD